MNPQPYARGIPRNFLCSCRRSRRRSLFCLCFLLLFRDDRGEFQFVKSADDGIVGVIGRYVDYDVVLEVFGCFCSEDFVSSEIGGGVGG